MWPAGQTPWALAGRLWVMGKPAGVSEQRGDKAWVAFVQCPGALLGQLSQETGSRQKVEALEGTALGGPETDPAVDLKEGL